MEKDLLIDLLMIQAKEKAKTQYHDKLENLKSKDRYKLKLEYESIANEIITSVLKQNDLLKVFNIDFVKMLKRDFMFDVLLTY